MASKLTQNYFSGQGLFACISFYVQKLVLIQMHGEWYCYDKNIMNESMY